MSIFMTIGQCEQLIQFKIFAGGENEKEPKKTINFFRLFKKYISSTFQNARETQNSFKILNHSENAVDNFFTRLLYL